MAWLLKPLKCHVMIVMPEFAFQATYNWMPACSIIAVKPERA